MDERVFTTLLLTVEMLFFFFFGRNFCIRRDFITNPSSLKKRLMAVGFGMLLISPFLVIFMLVYLFLRHAEQFYNHPSTASSRRWSNLSKWIFREFNEVLLILSNLYFSNIFMCDTASSSDHMNHIFSEYHFFHLRRWSCTQNLNYDHLCFIYSMGRYVINIRFMSVDVPIRVQNQYGVSD